MWMVILMNEEKKYTYQEDVQVEIDKIMKKERSNYSKCSNFLFGNRSSTVYFTSFI